VYIYANAEARFASIPTPSSGYVLHTLVAALYTFFATSTFQEGAILVVNMGNDADTVGAVYAGLAGCWYGSKCETHEGGLFWTPKVDEWMLALVKRNMVENVAEDLVLFSERLGAEATSSSESEVPASSLKLS
jgi:ADP-ribosyl-[dinitrogen reductase] hydrolase